MGSIILGFLLIAISVTGLFIVGRRQFNRRNAAGVEEFRGYGSMLGSRFMEALIRIAAAFMFIIGVVLAIKGYASL